jgi:hypothetical protein
MFPSADCVEGGNRIEEKNLGGYVRQLWGLFVRCMVTSPSQSLLVHNAVLGDIPLTRDTVVFWLS